MQDLKIEGQPKILKNKELENIVYEKIFENIDNIINGRYVNPYCYAMTRHGIVEIPVIFSNEKEKMKWKIATYLFCTMIKAEYIVFIKDSFLLEVKTMDIEEYLNSPDYVMPRNSPDRIEALVVLVLTNDMRQEYLNFKYRDADQKLIMDKTIKWQYSETKYGGNLFKSWRIN